MKKSHSITVVLGSILMSASFAKAELVFDSPNAMNATLPAAPAARVVQAQPQVILVQQPQSQAPVQPVQTAPNPQQPQQILVQAQPQPQIVVQQPQQVAQPVLMQPAAQQDSNTESEMTRAELLRRARMREEIKNEDELKARLEELRLREEQRLTQNLSQQADSLSVPQAAPAQAAAVAAPPVVEQVKVPVTEQQNFGQSITKSGTFLEISNPLQGFTVSLVPTAGTTLFTGQALGFDVSPRFSLGATVLANVNDYFSIEAGYRYSQFGVAMMNTNFLVAQIQNYLFAMGQPFANENMIMNQHVADLGVRVYLLDRSIRFRPFVGAGLAYSASLTNYSPQIRQYLSQFAFSGGMDYTVQSLLGSLSGGLDVQISRNIALGIGAKYHMVMTSWQNLGNPWFVDFGKATAGGILGAAPMLSVFGNVTVSF